MYKNFAWYEHNQSSIWTKVKQALQRIHKSNLHKIDTEMQKIYISAMVLPKVWMRKEENSNVRELTASN